MLSKDQIKEIIIKEMRHQYNHEDLRVMKPYAFRDDEFTLAGELHVGKVADAVYTRMVSASKVRA